MKHNPNWMDSCFPFKKVLEGTDKIELLKRVERGMHKPLSGFKERREDDGSIVYGILVELNGYGKHRREGNGGS